jgi:hypothetical protein
MAAVGAPEPRTLHGIVQIKNCVHQGGLPTLRTGLTG